MTKRIAAVLIMMSVAFVAGFAVAQIHDANGSRAVVRERRGESLEVARVTEQPLPLHRHEHPRVIVALKGGTMKVLEEDGQSETHEWESGKAYWLPANAPGTRHQDVNMGDKAIEVVVVELQKAN